MNNLGLLARLLKSDLARGFAVAATLAALIALAATLMSASTSLIVDTTTATNRLSERAKIPDLIQMHSGTADVSAIEGWIAGRDDITDHEIIETLPIPRQGLTIAGVNQADSYHEPAFVTSPEHIDLLLDDHGDPAHPNPGEVALPIHYSAVGAAKVGDTITFDTGTWKKELKVTGFIRDAQMNAAMVPSKRLVVHPQDFADFADHIEDREYLIEFALAESTRPGTVLNAYKAAGLPATGVSIDSSMLRLMNSISTMLIAAVALLVAFVLMIVAMLALRYTVLAAIEVDLARIAVLKAIGAPQRQIRGLYLVKYLVLAAFGCIIGYLAGYPLSAALGAPTLLYLGTPPTTTLGILAPILAVLALAAAIIGFTWVALGRVGRISAIEALRTGTSGSFRKRRNRWHLTSVRRLPVPQWMGIREALRPSNALLLGVLALCTFTMVLPTNVATTLDDPRIGTYLGSGQADLRIDVRAGVQDLASVAEVIDADQRISKHATVLRRDYKMETTSGEWESVLIDIGDHQAFPMQYLTGSAPLAEDEIALSYSQSAATGANVGSTVKVRTKDGDTPFQVTGVYQDITNNGLTAKATFDDGAPALWQIIYADVQNKDLEAAVSEDLRAQLPGVQVTGASEYASQFFGATSSQIRIIALLACGIALSLAFLITMLFTVLVLSRERQQIGILKALGSSDRSVAGQYFTRFGILTLLGLAFGLLLATTVGEGAIGVILGPRGAPNVELLANFALVGVVIPGALLATIAGAVALAVRRVRSITLA